MCRSKSFRCSKKAYAHEQKCAAELLEQQRGVMTVTTDDDASDESTATSAQNNHSKKSRRRLKRRRSVAAPESDTASRGQKKARKKQPKKKECKRVQATPSDLDSIKTILNQPSKLDRYWPKLDDSVTKTLVSCTKVFISQARFYHIFIFCL